MKVPFFVPWISKNDKKSIMNVLDQRWLTNGPQIKKFEQMFREFLKTKYCVGVGSATNALHLSLRALNIGPGDEVIVPTFTFAASANAVDFCQGTPILTDVDSSTFNITASEIEKNISKKTKAIVVVHYGGQSCDMSEIMKISKKNKIPVVEDCAHSLGSLYKGKMCGSIGSTGCFSFYPTKVITTGEGGMLSTNSSNLFKIVNSLRTHGMSILPPQREKKGSWKYDIKDLGYNYRLDEIRSALGISQLMRINDINKKRINLANIYTKKLSKVPGIITPIQKPDRNHIYHLYTIKITKDYHLTRNELFEKLHKSGIGSSVQYIPLHDMSFYKQKYRSKQNKFKNSNLIKNQVLSLPLFPTMTKKQIEFVIKTIQ